MNQQDLVWVKFPFSNLEESKIRPAIIISNNSYNEVKRDVLICAITSNLYSEKYSLIIDNKNLLGGDLKIKSKIRGDKILLINKKLIIKSFGKLNNETFDNLIKEVISLINRNDN